jgi:hypothetical protein
MRHKFNDGGRSKYFNAPNVGDCVCRAIAIATNKDYKEVYTAIKKVTKENPRNGLSKRATKKICEFYGGKWVATMTIGSGCKTHLKESELPMGRLVCSLSGHVTCVIDGVINDTYDCSRGETRCVYGYWKFK